MDVAYRSERQSLRVPSSSPPGSPAATTIILVAVVAALYLGQELLIPLALSILLSFALAPFAIRLRRLGLGRIPSVLLVVTLVFLVVMGFGALVTSQIASLAQNVGRYEYNFRTKIRALAS
jgi:predicted PurR-regulated permease PerM